MGDSSYPMPHPVFRIPKKLLWIELRRVRDYYEENHPLSEALLALGIRDANDPDGARAAHREIIDTVNGRGEPLPELLLCERDDEWLLLPPVDDEMFLQAWTRQAWKLTPVFGPPELFAPSRPVSNEELRSWLNTQLRERRCLRYPLLDATRMRREADYMLSHVGDIDGTDIPGVRTPIRV